MVEVRNNGVPLIEQAPRAGITQAMLTLADALCGEGQEESEEAANKKPGWLSFLGGKAKAKT